VESTKTSPRTKGPTMPNDLDNKASRGEQQLPINEGSCPIKYRGTFKSKEKVPKGRILRRGTQELFVKNSLEPVFIFAKNTREF